MRFILSFLFFISTLVSFGQDIIQEVNRLVNEKKYATAFSMLQVADSDNENVSLVLKKVDLAMNYSLDDVGFRMFSFVDLKSDESFKDAYENESNRRLPMTMFPIDEVLDSLAAKHPKNGLIQKELANYFYYVYLSYPYDWVLEPEEILHRLKFHAQRAIDLDEYDYMTYFQLGFMALQKEDYLNAITPFMLAYKLEQNDPILTYNLAISYFKANQFAQAAIYAVHSINAYNDSLLKSDAAQLAATAFRAQENYEKALEHYQWSIDLNPDNLRAYKSMLEIALHKKSTDKGLQRAILYHEQALEYPPLVNDILQLTIHYELEPIWEQFFKTQLKQYKKEDLVAGILLFHNGHYLLHKEDYKSAIKQFKNARKQLKRAYDEEHDVFKIIEEIIVNSEKELKKKKD